MILSFLIMINLSLLNCVAILFLLKICSELLLFVVLVRTFSILFGVIIFVYNYYSLFVVMVQETASLTVSTQVTPSSYWLNLFYFYSNYHSPQQTVVHQNYPPPFHTDKPSSFYLSTHPAQIITSANTLSH